MQHFCGSGEGYLVALRDRHGARTTWPGSHLLKQTLTLSQPKVHSVAAAQMFLEGRAVPRARGKAKVARCFPQIGLYSPPLNGVERPRATGALGLVKAFESPRLESSHPALHGAGTLPKPLGDFRTRPTGSDEQQCVQTMLVTRYFVAINLAPDHRLHKLCTLQLLLNHMGLIGWGADASALHIDEI